MMTISDKGFVWTRLRLERTNIRQKEVSKKHKLQSVVETRPVNFKNDQCKPLRRGHLSKWTSLARINLLSLANKSKRASFYTMKLIVRF